MSYSLVIFDLDGTLVDSFPWFLRNLNDVADAFGFRRIAADEIEDLRHAGAREILKRLDVPLWKLPVIAAHMRRLKAAHAGAIALFPGADAMLRALKDAGVTLALVTSDNEANARRLLRDSAALFADVDCGASIFGKAKKFRRVVTRAGLERRAAITVGDEARDIEAAREAGLACAAVTWGYAAPAALRAHKPDIVFERMEDIVAHLAPAAVAGLRERRFAPTLVPDSGDRS
jgi:phosphoglycolate phosphatase